MRIFGKINRIIKKKSTIYSILFLILFISFLVLLTTWSIVSSLNLFKYESTTNELPIVTVEFDADSIAEDEVDLENDEIILPSKKEYEQIAKLEGVDSYEINLLDIYLSPNLSDVSADEFSELGLFTIKGITGNPIFDEKLNNIKIIDGRLISEDEIRNGANSVLISEEVAQKNNLEAGDDILLQISNIENSKEFLEQEIQVVGIFKPSGEIGSEPVANINLSYELADLLEHDHAHEEDGHSHAHEEEHSHGGEDGHSHAHEEEHSHGGEDGHSHAHEEEHSHDEEDGHSHAHEEEHSHDEEDNNTNQTSDSETLSHSEYDTVIDLQKFLLLENLNTIYMPNNTAETILKNVDEEFNNELSDINYQASYVLNSHDKVNEFMSEAEKILPEYFTVYGVEEAYSLWLPMTSYFTVIAEYIVLFLFMLSLIILILLTIMLSSNNRELLFRYLLLGKKYKDFSKNFFLRHVIFVTSTIFISILLAPMLSRRIISEYLTSIEFNTEGYNNIQNLTRNLVDTSVNIADYASLNEYYLIGAVFIYITVILVVFITIQVLRKKLLKGVLE
jgi:hypothetical protein